jgi:hypothetical protein
MIGRRISKSEFEGMLKEAVEAYFQVLFALRY